jgi:hypothetical protein
MSNPQGGGDTHPHGVNSFDTRADLQYLGSVMDAGFRRVNRTDAREERSGVELAPSRLPGSQVHPCEHCMCCSCRRVCTRCRDNCSPMDSCFIPVIGCPDFADMTTIRPVRYLYRTGWDRECRLRLPGAR